MYSQMYSTVYVSLVVLLHLTNATSAADVTAVVGASARIPCKINGSYVLPEWLKDGSISIVNQADPMINPAYSARISYDSDQRTLIVNPVILNDTGNYVCTHTGGTGSPQTTTVEIKVSGKTTNKNGTKVQTANRIFFGLAEVVVTVVIIICCFILINACKKRPHNMIKMEDKQNEKKKKIKVLMILIVVAVLLFITVSVFFIVMQTTVEDFEKLTENEHIANIALLIVESAVFVLGVIAIYPIWKKLRPD